MTYSFRPAVREQTSLLIGIAGPSGSGKTASALKLARGILGGQDEGIFVIDTEASRASHYACAPGEKVGPFSFRFQHCDMGPPFSPDAYRSAISAAIEAGAKVVIVDSMSHAHEGEGGMLDAFQVEHARMGGKESTKFAAWIRPKAEQVKLVNFILQQRCHFIFCFRAKEKMKLLKVAKRDGREGIEPVQLGWTPICSDRFEYEMTTLLMLPPTARGVPDLSLESTKVNAHHLDFFPVGKPIDEECGRRLAEWARGGASAPTPAGVGGISTGGSAPAITGAPVLTTAQKISAAEHALRLPEGYLERIATRKLGGPLKGAPDEEVEDKLLPYLRLLAKKDKGALDELAEIIAATAPAKEEATTA